VAEAMATGVPCVVTDVGDSAQVIGGYGWLCPVGDSRAIAQAVLTGLKSLPVDTVRLRQHICDQYSTSALVQRTAEHLRKLTPGRTPHGARGLKAEL
jgi:glycosyltransferase involved in cell wall biosynthesis